MAIEKLGDILLLERLAAGGMAEVFRAKQYGHSGFEKTVAVKRILPSYSASEEFKTMFRMEANLSAQLQHPNIAQVFSNGSLGEYLYIVMEFVDGKNLRQLFVKAEKTRTAIPTELACFVVCEAAKGLDFAHTFHDEKTGQSLDIVHRDVNHQNIMLSYDGGVKIVDFGVAKAADPEAHKTKAGVLKGKISYMSPEQVRGKSIDCRTDIFSLGIVLWELLAGRPLFMTDDEFETLENVRNCEIPDLIEINSSIKPSLNAIVKMALAKNPDERYQTSRAFYSSLQRYLNEHHPQFIQSDVSAYLRDLFKQEIAEEKARKEKINTEAKLYLQRNPILRPSKSRIFGDNPSPQTQVQNPKSTQVAPPPKGVKDFQDATIASPSAVKNENSMSKLNNLEKSFGSWSQTNSQVTVPKFQYDTSGTQSQVYASAVQSHSTKLIVLLLVIVTGIIYTWFKERERLLFASYDNSRMEKWSDEFRSNFDQSCSSVIGKKGYRVNPVQLCECLSKSVENAHLLSTKFNPNIATEEELANRNLQQFQFYISTEEGQKANLECVRKLASE
jgi:serine/threonine protein kinase